MARWPRGGVPGNDCRGDGSGFDPANDHFAAMYVCRTPGNEGMRYVRPEGSLRARATSLLGLQDGGFSRAIILQKSGEECDVSTYVCICLIRVRRKGEEAVQRGW